LRERVGCKGAAWDELIASPDRHHQNALFDGVNWWLFDHDQALLESGAFCKTMDPTQRSLMCTFSARCNILAKQMVKRLRSQNNISAQPALFDRHKAEMALLSSCGKVEARAPQKSKDFLDHCYTFDSYRIATTSFGATYFKSNSATGLSKPMELDYGMDFQVPTVAARFSPVYWEPMVGSEEDYRSCSY
jgi:hypothetical protein